jgi:glycosyltransferase involved in cell wall biosynthesis
VRNHGHPTSSAIIARVSRRRNEWPEQLGAQRGDIVVCVAAEHDDEHFARGMQSVLVQTSRQIRILVCGEAPQGRALDSDERDSERVTLAPDLDAAIAASAPADVVILSSGCTVAAGWLEGLAAAAYADSVNASASALSAEALLPSTLAAGQRSFDQAAAAVRAASAHVRPRLRAAQGPCFFVRRSAVELVGGFDGRFSMKSLQAGLCHVLADDVLVSPGGTRRSTPQDVLSPPAPVVRSLGVARRALQGLSIGVDARVLGGQMNGTAVHVLELIGALDRTGSARVTALVADDLSPALRARLEELGDVVLVSAETICGSKPPVRLDIVHRPVQIAAPADLTLLASLAERLVITHQDLISYHNPSYFASDAAWEGYREMTRRALGVADRVLFFSEHVRSEALAEDLVEPGRADVVRLGVDHTVTRDDHLPHLPPAGVDGLPEGVEMMLCLGTDYRHKNRIFALRVLQELRTRHGWSGRLAMAGPRMPFGSSIPDEQSLLAQTAGLAEFVISLGALSEREKAWLIRRSSLVVYPTVHEGFGLVPFEAADNGVPCLWAPGTSLSEVLPDAAARILPWDAATTADQAWELMRDGRAATRNVEAIRSGAALLKWDSTAAQLIDVYRSVCDGPSNPAGALERTQGLMRHGFSEDAVRLVGPNGALPGDLERPLLALASHPRLSAPVFRALRAGYRISSRWRRRDASDNGRAR